MHSKFINLILIILLYISCREPYNPKIDEGQNALVVEGLVTDDSIPYEVKLSIAETFNNSNGYTPVHSARVSVYDNMGNTYYFRESGNEYITDSNEFVGMPGRTYTLYIETQDGNVYESTPQLMPANDFTDSASAELESKETLVRNYSGDYTVSNVQGVTLLTDIKYRSDTLPRLRFSPSIISEYTWFNTYHPEWPAFFLQDFYSRTPAFFCWSTSVPRDLISLTGEEYSTSLNLIQKHSVCFIPTYYTYATMEFDTLFPSITIYPRSLPPVTFEILPPDTILNAKIENRVIIVKRYSLNQEAYQFYKNVNSLLTAEGKIFDPVPRQFKGNILCKNDPQRKVLGFFEASSVKTNYYAIKPGSDSVQIVKTINFPSAKGFVRWDSIERSSFDPHLYDEQPPVPPDFWIK
jgi:hypothetical protein